METRSHMAILSTDGWRRGAIPSTDRDAGLGSDPEY